MQDDMKTSINEQVLTSLKEEKECVWINQNIKSVQPGSDIGGMRFVEMRAANERLIRFAPFIEKAFPETAPRKGIIESVLKEASNLAENVDAEWKKEGRTVPFSGKVFVKMDSELPIAGSVKARGGIYEVLTYAEKLLWKEKAWKPTMDYTKLLTDEYKELFGGYKLQVGSTGNLGISIGMMGAKLGFETIVHMSRDAKQWKKDLLRSQNVTVVEYEDDYSCAVEQGRKKSLEDPKSYFIDDENSRDLFMGYAAAALRMKIQLYKAGIHVDEEHPLFVYIPCGVGGAPGGITFGLKEMFGDYVHCFFVEPTKAPCMMLALEKGKATAVSEIGLSCKTVADGLAVGKASELVASVMREILSGTMTVSDERLGDYQKTIYETEQIYLEKSACAGLEGLNALHTNELWDKYIVPNQLEENMAQATHIIWATGGSMVPEEIKKEELGIFEDK